MEPSAVLVVDDDRQICGFLKELLTMDGFDVGVAHSYREALQALNTKRFDYALIDFLYPEDNDHRDGVDILMAARKRFPAIQAYLMTGLVNDVPLAPLMSRGFNGILPKPFTVGSVRSLLGYR
jgi:CheY-like chemotaxis protein